MAHEGVTNQDVLLVALHMCYRGVGDWDSASLVGGVNLILAPVLSLAFSIGGMTSPAGRCHTFDSRADGYARAEGCGIANMQDAISSSALARCASRMMQDGRGASLTAPNGTAQQQLVETVILPSAASACYEFHGTGTKLGDPVEARSVALKVNVPTVCTSVKGSVAHAESAAGLVGTLQALMLLDLGMAPPNAQLRITNPYVEECVRQKEFLIGASIAGSMPTPAAYVNSFGYSGTLVSLALTATP